MKKKFTLKKNQILRTKREIDCLFKNGKTQIVFPLKSVYYTQPIEKTTENDQDKSRHKVMFIVPKKNIRKAAHRNKIKRKIRESFRLLQYHLNIPDDHICYIAFIYISRSRTKEELDKIHPSVLQILESINENFLMG